MSFNSFKAFKKTGDLKILNLEFFIWDRILSIILYKKYGSIAECLCKDILDEKSGQETWMKNWILGGKLMNCLKMQLEFHGRKGTQTAMKCKVVISVLGNF